MLLSYIHLLWPFNHLLLESVDMERDICNLCQSSSKDFQCQYTTSCTIYSNAYILLANYP